jgi:hypothetical protein
MKKLIAISAAFYAFAAAAQAQNADTSPPTITMDTPVNGVAVATDRITVEGEATDDVGVSRVEYRIEGRRRWRRAIVLSTGAYTFSFKNTKKGRARRVYVRAIDAAKNESDTIGRKIFRAR